MHGVLLGLEFRMHEGVSSPGILKGGGAKNSDILTSEVCKTSPVCAHAGFELDNGSYLRSK